MINVLRPGPRGRAGATPDEPVEERTQDNPTRYDTANVIRIEHREHGTELTVDGATLPLTVSEDVSVDADFPSVTVTLLAKRIEIVNDRPQVPAT